MPVDIFLPALSPTMEKGTIVRWLKRIGEPVRVGEVLLEVETDKATLEIEALAAGTLTSIIFQEGATDVPVNVSLGTIIEMNEAKDSGAALIGSVSSASREAEGDTIWKLLSSPKQDGFEDRIFASPIARRLMKESGVDPRSVKASGPNGRILGRDIRAPAVSDVLAPTAGSDIVVPRQAPPSSASVGQPASIVGKQFVSGRFEEAPHDGVRRIIARRLTESKQAVPHFYLTADCRLDPLLKLREQLNKGRSDAPDRLSLNDFFIKALARALMLVPDANVSFAEDAMIRHKHADIAVAVAITGGLVTPVLRDAETKSVLTISAEMKGLIRRARARQISREEYEGGTSGLSNLGMFGVRDFAAILNPPQATMLALGAAEKRMIVVDDAPSVATMLTATLSVDHRAVDGAIAATLISSFKTLVEEPVSMLV
jgi:pyruvate dehydrogenase E2 component (dihydrolipoamide acetyltransferase)